MEAIQPKFFTQEYFKSAKFSYKNLKLYLGMGASALVLSGCASSYEPGSENPNIILISVDDMGWSDIGCYGSEIQTPNLDRLDAWLIKLQGYCKKCDKINNLEVLGSKPKYSLI